jgi:hypothetical protein
LKTQKLEEVAEMPAAAAAEILGRAAEAQVTDARVTDRIANVQDLLADDLRWIESALSSVVDEGEAPATLAAASSGDPRRQARASDGTDAQRGLLWTRDPGGARARAGL